MRDDGLAAEQKIERMDDGEAHRRPIGDRHRGAMGREDRDHVVGPDAVRPEPASGSGNQAEEIPRRRRRRRWIQRRSQIDDRILIGLRCDAARNQAEDVRTVLENRTRVGLERFAISSRILDRHSPPRPIRPTTPAFRCGRCATFRRRDRRVKCTSGSVKSKKTAGAAAFAIRGVESQEPRSALDGSPTMKARVSGGTSFRRSWMNLSWTPKLSFSGRPTVETRNSAPSGIHPLRPYSSLSA